MQCPWPKPVAAEDWLEHLFCQRQPQHELETAEPLNVKGWGADWELSDLNMRGLTHAIWVLYMHWEQLVHTAERGILHVWHSLIGKP